MVVAISYDISFIRKIKQYVESACTLKFEIDIVIAIDKTNSTQFWRMIWFSKVCASNKQKETIEKAIHPHCNSEENKYINCSAVIHYKLC